MLRRAALRIDRGRRDFDRQARIEPRGAGDVAGLHTDLAHTAADHLADLHGVDPGALDHLALHRSEQIDAVHRRQATVAPADGSTHRFDDHYICHTLRPLEHDFVEHIRLAAGI